MSEYALDVQGVSKRFRLYHEKYTSLKERILHAGSIPFEDFWALRDVDVQVETGETVGILGRNGSGKSTLLKCMAGILQPTSGQIVVRGQLAPMLELGAGMQPELSGRDNIYLNGSLLGLSRREIDRRFADIVEFAELEKFIDNQVKYYSSGMYVRLGFAVAVNVEPDVLLIDEVLAVGDERFQQKCLDRVKQFQREGRTIIFVSHSADLMRTICQRVMVFENGNVLTIAPPGEAIRTFRESLLEAGGALGEELIETVVDAAVLAEPPPPKRAVNITGCRIVGRGVSPHLLPGEPLEVGVDFDVTKPLTGVAFGISIFGNAGVLIYTSSTESIGQLYDLEPGPGSLSFHFGTVPLLDGSFTITVRVQEAGGGFVYDVAEEACRFEVVNPGRSTGLVALGLVAEMHGAPAGPAAAEDEADLSAALPVQGVLP
jgi:ABC-2 type transport system ATP-binding protein